MNGELTTRSRISQKHHNKINMQSLNWRQDLIDMRGI